MLQPTYDDARRNANCQRKLFDFLFAIQQKLHNKEPFHLISGYRSRRTNALLRKQNSRVAPKSLHIYGKAADIRLPGNSLKLLNKDRLTSDYTFVYASNKSAESILRIDTLREAGIGDILVEIGKISEEEKESLEKKFDSDPIYY